VVGRPRKFVVVQVKCTVAELESGIAYVWSVKSNHKTVRAGAFDFLAAYVIPEDTWYLVPAKLIRGLASICLCSHVANEEYREAWHLLQTRSECEESHFSPDQREAGHPPKSELEGSPVGLGVARMQTAMNSFRSYLEKGGRAPR